MDNVKILAVVGMSGAGKSVVVDYLTDKGYPKVYFGGMIYKEMEKRGILLDKNDHVIGVIDFCFAGTGNPNMDVARMVSRPSPAEFEKAFLSYFENTGEISRMKEAWQHIDNGYAEHIRKCFPEINLNQL